jgi:hypothetical protein
MHRATISALNVQGILNFIRAVNVLTLVPTVTILTLHLMFALLVLLIAKLVLALLRIIVNHVRFLLMLFLLMEGVLTLVPMKKVLFQEIICIVKLALMDARLVQDPTQMNVYLA